MSDAWPITLKMFEPDVLDNSATETHSRCPRKWLYRYGLRRAPDGANFPIGFGIAYHKYREVVGELMQEKGPMTEDIHLDGVATAILDFEEAPLGHRHDFMTTRRLLTTLDMARERIENEEHQGAIKVLRSEDAFDLPLPYFFCLTCGLEYKEEEVMGNCVCGGELRQMRFGGRVDQIIDWRGRLWLRDFKTTSRMGVTYPRQFSPNNQMSGYVWAASQLSGRDVDGVLIEVVYNTKTKGPEIHQFLSTRSPGELEGWMASTFREQGALRRGIASASTDGYLAFPQRTLACNDYGGCFFRDACAQDSSWALEKWLGEHTKYSEWDFTDPEKEKAKG